jgi:hypothetical protein
MDSQDHAMNLAKQLGGMVQQETQPIANQPTIE